MISPAKCVSAGSSGTTTDGQHEKSDRRLLIFRLRSILSINDLRWRRVFARRDRLTIFSLLFGIPLYKLPQGTNNQVNVTYLYLTPFCHSGVTLLRDPTCLQWYLLISACRAFALNTQNYWFPH